MSREDGVTEITGDAREALGLRPVSDNVGIMTNLEWAKAHYAEAAHRAAHGLPYPLAPASPAELRTWALSRALERK